MGPRSFLACKEVADALLGPEAVGVSSPRAGDESAVAAGLRREEFEASGRSRDCLAPGRKRNEGIVLRVDDAQRNMDARDQPARRGAAVEIRGVRESELRRGHDFVPFEEGVDALQAAALVALRKA